MDKPRISIQLNEENHEPKRDKPEPEMTRPSFMDKQEQPPPPSFDRRFHRRNKKNPLLSRLQQSPWVRVALTVSSAVALGLLFGIVVLTVFVNENWDSQAAMQNVNHTLTEQNEGEKTPLATQTDQEPEPSVVASEQTELPIIIPEQVFYMVQAGAFSEMAGAEAAAQTFKKKGWPAQLVNRDTIHLFSAVAKKRDDTLSLASFFRDQQVDIYVKEWQVTGVNGKLAVPSATETDQLLHRFLNQGDQLVSKIGTLTAAHMPNGGNLQQEAWKETVDQHRQFLETSQSLRQNFSDDLAETLSRMTRDVTQAISAVEHYRDQPSTAFLWQAQQGLLHYVAHYEQLMKQLNQQLK